MNNKSVLDKISVIYDNLFDTEKKIAKYVLNNPNKVIDMTVSTLAKESKVSIASVSRFCKKIGLEGFHQLKISLAKEESEKGENIDISNDISMDNIKGSLHNFLANKIEEIMQTIININEEELKKIIQVILNAKKLQIVAVGNTIPVALDAAFKFNELGIPTVAGSIWETQLSYSFSLNKDDVLIAISNSGESTKVLESIKIAKDNKCMTIGITNNRESSIGKEVNYHITTATREKLFLDEFCFSRVSAITVIEIIFLFLVNNISDAHEKMINREQLFAADKK